MHSVEFLFIIYYFFISFFDIAISFKDPEVVHTTYSI
jgi:hypothetical protein